MKKIFVFLILAPIILRAQQNNYEKVRVFTTSVTATNSERLDSLTNNSLVNQIATNHNVTNYRQVYSFAKTQKLHEVHEFTCDCNADNLIHDLSTNLPGLFQSFRKLEYENISLVEPSDWLYHAPEDWLWFLKTIDAPGAWEITTGSPDVVVAVIDNWFDLTHPDLSSEFILNYDPYDSLEFTCSPPFFIPVEGHGTHVASLVSAQTTPNGEQATSDLASIGWNTKMIGYKAWAGNYLDRALHASTTMNAKIITSSAGGWSTCPDLTGEDELVVKEILDNGTIVIMPAGNGYGPNATYNFCAQIDPIHHSPFFPLSPYYDERIIIVSSTGIDDKHQFISSDSVNVTHSHYPSVDLCSPGYGVFVADRTQCGASIWPYAGGANGTSFATPIVAGVASLMASVNDCISPAICQDILKNSTDPILDAQNFPGLVGTGRVNAKKAVKGALDSYSPNLDLFIKDRPEDFGNEVHPYHWQADRDKSPDIWVRNQNDGFTNMTHQEPEYSSINPSYIYVRVWNKSCEDAAGDETLRLYWTKAGTMTSWPQNWDGTDPNIGDLVGEIPIGELKAGQTKIYEFTWNILNPYIHQNWATCLLARIEDSATDLITIHPNNASDDVYFNNNIALRNVTITDVYPGILNPIGVVDGIYHPHGKYIFIGNANPIGETFDFAFNSDGENKIKDFAEIKIIFDNEGWTIMKPFIINNPDFRIMREREVILVKDSAVISGVEFAPNKRIPVFVGFSFLAEHSELEQEFDFHVRQYHSNNQHIIGGEHFIINKGIRPHFYADAGNDKEIDLGQTVVISAQEITELAIYNWYDEDGNLIHTGREFYLTPEITRKYNLELIAISDGSKAFDQIKVEVKKDKIISMSPNPASNIVNIEYLIDDNSSSYLMIINQTATQSNNYILSNQQNNVSISLNSYPSGLYTVVLITNGVVVDAKHLLVN
jgi:subtilisin family serine protease